MQSTSAVQQQPQQPVDKGQHEKLPYDILVDIFEYIDANFDTPLKPLLPVCKSWSDAALYVYYSKTTLLGHHITAIKNNVDIIKYGEYIRELVLKSNDGQRQMWNKPQLMNVLKTMPRLNHLAMKQSSHAIHYCKHLIKIETKKSRKVAEPIQHLVKADISLRSELTNNIFNGYKREYFNLCHVLKDRLQNIHLMYFPEGGVTFDGDSRVYRNYLEYLSVFRNLTDVQVSEYHLDQGFGPATIMTTIMHHCSKLVKLDTYSCTVSNDVEFIRTAPPPPTNQ